MRMVIGVADATPEFVGDVNVIELEVVLTPHVSAAALRAVDDDEPFTRMSTSSTPISPRTNSLTPVGKANSIVWPITKPFGVINSMVWLDPTPGAEVCSVSLAFVIDAASALRSSAGKPVLQRSSAKPADIATV